MQTIFCHSFQAAFNFKWSNKIFTTKSIIFALINTVYMLCNMRYLNMMLIKQMIGVPTSKCLQIFNLVYHQNTIREDSAYEIVIVYLLVFWHRSIDKQKQRFHKIRVEQRLSTLSYAFISGRTAPNRSDPSYSLLFSKTSQHKNSPVLVIYSWV